MVFFSHPGPGFGKKIGGWRFDMVLGCFMWMVIRFFGGYE